MRKFLAAAVPALLLLAAAAPGHAQTSSGRANAANSTMDSGARDVQASRDMIGKRVVHRHGGPVAGTIQNVTTGADGQTMVELKLAGTGQTMMLTPASFERRGRQVVIMHDRNELQQLAQYSSQATTGYGSSTGGAMGGQQMGNGMGSGSMGGSMSAPMGTPMNGTPDRMMTPTQPPMGQ
ncbi:hypothetical protein VY88_09800 [Azospirillum thiophilum]|uniref:PRC-barrel domain-containing protein n=1 Tax=Azospirillum thiophilum TaxID=528244 RepID=A0AAC8VV91_9PROT|nr:hypothetical protein [Azospirillum thiophilum]ALG70040.1 hypothetical protein AL072_02910 [Azospirillum thiophilum]KJR66278.1 hypothetical protein VY88_09800 [Azospirillum thiophilum]